MREGDARYYSCCNDPSIEGSLRRHPHSNLTFHVADLNPNADAASLFRDSTLPDGLLLKRVRTRELTQWEVEAKAAERRGADSLEIQRRAPVAKMETSCSAKKEVSLLPTGGRTLKYGDALSKNQAKSIRRQVGLRACLEELLSQNRFALSCCRPVKLGDAHPLPSPG